MAARVDRGISVKPGRMLPIPRGMGFGLMVVYLVLAATLVRALALKLRLGTPTCARCGRPFERRTLGEPVCHCKR